MSEHHLDVMGEMCPLPILRSEKIFKTLKAGDTLIITSDHSCTVKAVPLHFAKYKAKTDINQVAKGIWQISIMKTI